MRCRLVYVCDVIGERSNFVFFFFKQKTAYEMRISDWSSDVCSSDLVAAAKARVEAALDAGITLFDTADIYGPDNGEPFGASELLLSRVQIGRASGRERVCQ